MGKSGKKRRGLLIPADIWRAMPVVTVVAGIALLCLIGGIVAHYVTQTTRGDNQIGAKDFYFTVDLLTASEDEPDENAVVSRDFTLYGGGQNTLSFCVQNFFDDLRVNAQEIGYTVSWKLEEGTGDVTVNDTSANSGTLSGTLTGGSAHEAAYKVTVAGASEGARVEITVASSQPYSKVMTMNMILYPQKYDVLYRVEDSAGSPYATLIVMVGKEEGVTLGDMILDWSTVNASANVLQVDTTDTDILLGDGGSGSVTVPITESGYLKTVAVTRALKQGESFSVYFFKTDPSRDYSQEDTVVEADANGDYTVTITENQ